MGTGSSSLEPQRSPFDDVSGSNEASIPPVAAAPQRVTLIPTVLQWTHGGRQVYVTGTFNNWAERIPMRESRADFTVCLNLPVGTFQYKFIVDNEWRFSPSQPLVQDAQGNVNNCITVLDEEVCALLHEGGSPFPPPPPFPSQVCVPLAAGQDFMREHHGSSRYNDNGLSSDGRFGQVIDDEMLATAKDPQPVPCQLTVRSCLLAESGGAPSHLAFRPPARHPQLGTRDRATDNGRGAAGSLALHAIASVLAAAVAIALGKRAGTEAPLGRWRASCSQHE